MTIELLKQNLPLFTQWRHIIHQHPELGFEEEKTAQFVKQKLEEFGFDEIHENIGKTGIVGVLYGKDSDLPEKRISLRADMDALPIQEANQFSHCSKHAGKMHACGHDGHTAILLASAWYLSQHRHFTGKINFIFQPAEEGLAGAKAMIEDGLFERFPCERVYGLHNMPNYTENNVFLCDNAILASSDKIQITIQGQGGHAAMPHLTIDPVVVASQLVLALQTIVSRNTYAHDSVVLSVTSIIAGDAFNVVPDSAQIKISLRTLNKEIRNNIVQRIESISQHTAQAYGASAEVKIVGIPHPPTISEPNAYNIALKAALNVVGEDNVDPNTTAIMASEDFAFMLEEKPGCYFIVGIGNNRPSVHHPQYDFNDNIIPTAASCFIAIVHEELG